MSARTGRWREWTLLAVVLAPLASILSRSPIPQDLAFHALADDRPWLGIPNFQNVASNLPFLLIGAAGLLLCAGRGAGGATRSWAVFFLGVALAFFGSAWYHWNPNNETLVWDRLPIVLAFMALFSALVSEHLGAGFERWVLAPAVAVGIASVVWWDYADDLRVYIWCQAAPILAIVFVLIAYRGRYTHRAYLACALAAYLLAKVAEFQDREVFALTSQAMSGHTLKHLLAALAIFFIYLMLRQRKQISAEDPVAP
jgi:hypothetical protein